MSTQRIKIIYVSSLVILAVLAAFIIFQPSVGNSEYIEVQQEQLLEAGGEWIIQFNILNNEVERQNYTINVMNGDENHSEKISIDALNVFAYIHHIQRDTVTDGEVKILICQDGKREPIEQLTYHLR